MPKLSTHGNYPLYSTASSCFYGFRCKFVGIICDAKIIIGYPITG